MPDNGPPRLPAMPPTRFGELPLAGPHGPGYTQQEYDEALGKVVPPLANAALMMGTSALGGPEVMTVGKLIQGLIAGLPMDEIPGVSLGMVPSLSNLPEFKGKLVENLSRLKSGTKLTPDTLERAMGEAYMATRYPNRYARIKEIKYGGLPPDVAGAYDAPGLFSRERVTVGQPGSQNVGSNVGTLAHESQHALQYGRDPNAFKNYPQQTAMAPGQLNPAYYEHPTEVGARQAAGTAQSGFDKFLDLIGYKAPPPLPGQEAAKTPWRGAARKMYEWVRDPNTGKLVPPSE